MYHNEREVGSSILAYISSPSNTSSLKREDIHFTSKLASNTSYDAARKSIKQSVKQSGLGYIDLFLLHSPYGGKTKRLECWKAVEDAIEDGEVKTGGVSNFGVKHVNHTLHFPLLSMIAVSFGQSLMHHLSCKSFSHRNLECTQPSTRSKYILSTLEPRSPPSAKNMISSSKHTLHWLELLG